MLIDKSYKLGVLYGTGPETEMLTQKFVGNLINNEEFCKACEVLEQNVKCDKCREYVKSFASSIYYYEKIGESFKLWVVKKDSSRVPYDRDKIIAGLQKACYKRPVSAEQIQQIADKVEENIFKNFDKEVTSGFIGESVMEQLGKVDKVAYIRFASVYRDFRDAGELIKEVSEAITEAEPVAQLMLFEE